MNKPKELYADDMPYWQTSKASADTWLEKVKEEIKRAGGVVQSTMYGDDELGRAAYMIRFRFDQDEFRMVWPVLKSRRGNLQAAKVQAVTMLYHAVKARAVEVRVRGARAAFYGDLLLTDGRTASEASQEAFLGSLPALLPAPTR
jgi:hypothetical protein